LVAINGDLFKSLTKEQQNIIQEEAKNLAEKERKLSIQQDIDGRKMFEAQGIEFVDISDADKQILKDMGEKIYNKYKDQPVGEVMTAIINTK
ncbi:MAG TPA: hypothetical protein PLF01_05445, partial [Alphaproteobacteria bacterium]|nr:hypothetical protein [Alphaproteobacteria bacterium]